jgi:hypothetical protein
MGWDGMGWERFMQLHLREKSASDVLRYMYLANAVMALTFPLAGRGNLDIDILGLQTQLCRNPLPFHGRT